MKLSSLTRKECEGVSDLWIRVLSSLGMALLAMITAFGGGLVFASFWAIVAFLVLVEWQRLIGISKPFGLRLIGLIVICFAATQISEGNYGLLASIFSGGVVLTAVLAPSGQKFWALAGLLYASLLASSVCLLRNSGADYGLMALIWLFCVVWGADISAYFAGRLIGGAKLAPHISPGKTWAGFIASLIGGCLSGLFAVFVLGTYFVSKSVTFAFLPLAVLSLLTALVAQGGDLLESALKRHFHVKDAGDLIPGHGGLMDRLDSFLAACCFAVVVALGHQGVATLASIKQGADHTLGQSRQVQAPNNGLPGSFASWADLPPNVPDIGANLLLW